MHPMIFPKVLCLIHIVSLAGDRISEWAIYRVNTCTDKQTDKLPSRILNPDLPVLGMLLATVGVANIGLEVGGLLIECLLQIILLILPYTLLYPTE